MKLPSGWSYHARKWDADVELNVDGLAYALNDDLYSSYQRVAKQRSAALAGTVLASSAPP